MRRLAWAVALVVTLTIALAGQPWIAVAQYGYQSPGKPAAGQEEKKTPPVKTVLGKVKAVTANAVILQVVQKDKSTKDLTFALDPEIRVRAGKQAMLVKEIKEGDTARVAYVETDGKLVAQAIVLQPAK